MNNNLGVALNSFTRLYKATLGFLLCCLIYSTPGIAGEFDTYSYKLEVNNNNKVCTHMADVYRQYFKKPFVTVATEAEFKKKGGKPPEPFPGVKGDWSNYDEFLYSFDPSSPEFDAIKWKLGTEISHTEGDPIQYATPFIAADLDINNDGKIKTVIKDAAMDIYFVPNRVNADVLFIYFQGDIDLTKEPIEAGMFFKGLNGHPPFAVIYGPTSTCMLVRPFVYDGVTYLSCYHRKWTKVIHDYVNPTPAQEYTDVLKFQGVEKLPDGRAPIKAETVCRFRMTVTK